MHACGILKSIAAPAYVELVYAPEQTDTHTRIHVSDDVLRTMMQKVSRTLNLRPTAKQLRRYRVGDLIYEQAWAQDEARVLHSPILRVQPFATHPNWLWTESKREKQAMHLFPSTLRLDDRCSVERLTFRLHHRAFLNFESQTYPDGEVVHKIFFNINLDHNIEVDAIAAILDKLLRKL